MRLEIIESRKSAHFRRPLNGNFPSLSLFEQSGKATPFGIWIQLEAADFFFEVFPIIFRAQLIAMSPKVKGRRAYGFSFFVKLPEARVEKMTVGGQKHWVLCRKRGSGIFAGAGVEVACLADPYLLSSWRLVCDTSQEQFYSKLINHSLCRHKLN